MKLINFDILNQIIELFVFGEYYEKKNVKENVKSGIKKNSN